MASQANLVPIYASLLSDQLTPVSAFHRIASGIDHAFLLESVVGGEKIARYSFLGASPIATVTAKGKRTVITDRSGDRVLNNVDPLEALEEVLGAYNVVHPKKLPRFLGGAVGYAAYDMIRHYEKLDSPPPDDGGFPDLQFGIYDRMIVFDHVQKLIHVVAHAHVASDADVDQAYDAACHRIQETADMLSDVRPEPVRVMIPESADAIAFQSNLSQKEFEDAVDRCRQYIRAGDIFQVVISQRLTAETVASPFEVYRALRVINPSPFMFYVQSPEVTLVGASPEILCRLEGRTVTSRPLAGTRPRGRTEAEDLGLEAELLADPKECAEHAMLVDLGRNDLGRLCEPGSVTVDDLMSIERYSHVMHICSNVTGTMAPGKTAFDAIRCVLPVGTVSGAPKIRAMQIIDEIEPVRRGPYAGAVGYIDFSDNMDTCISLRTLVVSPEENGKHRVYAQVGAGIVADSQPSAEYQETLNKAQSMLRALQLADAWTKSP